MRLAALVSRLNQVRYVESLLWAAKARGHDSVLLLDCSWDPTRGKAEEFPEPARLPTRFRASVDVVRLLSKPSGDVVGRVCDAVVTGPDVPGLHGGQAGRPFVAKLQLQWSDLLWLERPDRYDAVYVWSPEWVRWWRLAHPGCDHLAGNLVPVGMPQADLLTQIDPVEVARTLDVKPPCVVLFPFPFGSVPRTWATTAWASPWSLGWPTDAKLLRALRGFCDRAGLSLVAKARHKTEMPRHTREMVDRVVPDEPGEATALRLLSTAALSVGFHSLSAVDAVLSGVPALDVIVPGWNAYRNRVGFMVLMSVFPAQSVRAQQATAALEEAKTVGPIGRDARPDAYRAYTYHFCGGPPFWVGERIVEDVERRAR